MSIIAIVAGTACLFNVASAQNLGTCIGGLSPSHEVPQINLAASGTAVFYFPVPHDLSPSHDNETYIVYFQLNQTGLEDVVRADIHAGNASTVGGPTRITFIPNPVNFSDGSFGSVSGNVSTTFRTVQLIFASPGEHYINIHTNSHPAGAIRGQLGSIDYNPTACPRSKSNIPLIVGVVSAVAVIILILIIACACYLRRRAHSLAKKSGMAGLTTLNFDTDVMPFRDDKDKKHVEF